MSPRYDVIVCGGGTAGAAAAIAAARTGANTLVVESLSALGGTQTMGWVTPMMANHLGSHKLSRGLNVEIVGRQASIQPPGALDHGDEWYDPGALTLVLDRLAQEAGVTALFNATVSKAKRRGKKLAVIEVVCRGGPLTLEADSFVDCTGDAELCVLAGAEVMSGNDEGIHQPLTLRFTMAHVDVKRARTALRPFLRLDTDDYIELGYGEAKAGPMEPLIRAAIERGILKEDDLGYFQLFTVNGRPGELAFNAPRLSGFDPLDPFQLSRAYQVGREKVFRIAQFMRSTFDGFEQSYVGVVAPLMGIRESRRAVTDYVLTEDDHLTCRKFRNPVARNRYPIDIHLKTGIDYRKFPAGEYHDIPYESLVVRGLSNLWVAGRCAGATFVAQSAIRIQPVCRAMGEAAGVAAALCAESGRSSRRLPYSKLEPHLDLSLPG